MTKTLAAIPGLVTRLIGETRELVSAEAALGKAKVEERIAPIKRAAIFFSLAGILALTALIALAVGAILALATVIGPGWATTAVVVAILALAGLFALIGKRQLSRRAEPAS